MKRFLQSVLVFGLVISSFSSSVIAAPSNSNTSQLTLKERKDASHEEKVNDLIKMGVNLEDAEYYASLDDMLVDLEKSGKKIDLSNVKAMSPQEIASDPKGFKKKILEKNPAAIKAGLQSKAYSDGFKDMAELIEKNPNRKKYVVNYPDGSSVEVEVSEGVPDKSQSQKVKLLGYDEDMYWSSANCNGGGPGTCSNASTSWKFTSPVGWAKASVFNLDYTVRTIDGGTTWQSEIGYYDVGAASYGFVMYSTPNKNTKKYSGYWDAYDFSKPEPYAQAQGYFGASVSGSVDGSVTFKFASLGISVNGGAS
ncbi:hypothetical protein RZN22_13845 [Bacillaceae bacterium S4-13-58]